MINYNNFFIQKYLKLSFKIINYIIIINFIKIIINFIKIIIYLDLNHLIFY